MSRVLGRLYLGLVYAFLYVPLLVVFVYSFNNSRFSTNWNGFTLRWYQVLFNNSALLDAAVNSLMVAVCAATLATALGTLTALSLKRYRFTGRQFMYGGVFLLTVSPEIVMGISMLIMFIAFNIPLGFITLLIAHTTLCTPFVAVIVLARLAAFDEHLIEAARDLGASEGRAFWHVLLPMTFPAVAAGWLLSFTLSMDDVIISTFTTGPTFEVLPVRVYSMVRLGVRPELNALAAVMFVFTIVLVLLAQAINHIRRR